MATIYVCLPDPRYAAYRQTHLKYLEFARAFCSLIHSTDRLRVLAPASVRAEAEKRLPDDLLVESEVQDAWVRDFAPVRTPNGYLWFTFQPAYDQERAAPHIRKSFLRFPQSVGIEATECDLVMDGGTLVWNGRDKAVVTTRLYRDNVPAGRAATLERLRVATGIDTIAVIPEERGDVTGHADGTVAWIDESTLAISALPAAQLQCVEGVLRSAFPEARRVTLPYCPRGADNAQGFSAATGVYVNLLVTEHALYVPQYGLEEDAEALRALGAATDKAVVGVPCAEVATEGGAVRCLTWDVPCGAASERGGA